VAEQPVARRLAAILAADVVGYSRLMEVDETATQAALKSRRKDVLAPLVAKHHGRIFKTATVCSLSSRAQSTPCMRRRSATGHGGGKWWPIRRPSHHHAHWRKPGRHHSGDLYGDGDVLAGTTTTSIQIQRSLRHSCKHGHKIRAPRDKMDLLLTCGVLCVLNKANPNEKIQKIAPNARLEIAVLGDQLSTRLGSRATAFVRRHGVCVSRMPEPRDKQSSTVNLWASVRGLTRR
jgi:hypothetical protein